MMKFIELCGPFNAGKFTLISILVQMLAQLGHKVHSIQVDRSIPAGFIEKENYLDREMTILMGTISEIIRLRDASRADFVFIHRGPWDAMAFLRGLAKAKLISKEEAKWGISLAVAYATRIDLVVLVEISAQVSLDRSYLCPDIPRDIIKDISSLNALVSAYQALKNEFPSSSLVIDGTRPVGENIDIILKTVLSLDDCFMPSGQLIFMDTS